MCQVPRQRGILDAKGEGALLRQRLGQGALRRVPRDRVVAVVIRQRKPRSVFGTGGRRADLGNVYFRSMAEANYARYLNWLQGQGLIAEWEYEPKTFRFRGIQRGCVDYKPDFRVISIDCVVEWHEVKGYMDQRSRTKLKRMAKYYPNERVRIIGKEWFRTVGKTFSYIVPGWERGRKAA